MLNTIIPSLAPPGTALGYYMYVEASSGSSYDLARLESGYMKQAAATCVMNFWYHMYGNSIGSLYVYIKVGLVYSKLFELSGNQGEMMMVVMAMMMVVIMMMVMMMMMTDGDVDVDDCSDGGCDDYGV